MRVLSLLVVALSLVSLVCGAQDAALPVPVLQSVTNFVSSSSSQIQLVYSTPFLCPSGYYFCSFGLLVDGQASPSQLQFFTSALNYTWTLQTPLTSYGAGLHTFRLVVQAMMPSGAFSAPSNAVQQTVSPYTSSSPPVVTPNAGGIVGDPQFTGLRGQTYQVHGAPNEVFNLVTDADFQYNARFVYLAQGDCPSLDGRPVDTPCFTHPGTYLGELALETAAGDRLYLKAGGAEEGFAAVTLNGEALDEDEDVTELAALAGRAQPFVVRNSSHALTVQMGNFWLELTNSDAFINQRVAMLDSAARSSHGLLGQTWSGRIHDKDASIPWIEGDVWDYATADHELFSTRFVFNRFRGASDADQDDELPKPSLAKLLRAGGRRQGHKREEDM